MVDLWIWISDFEAKTKVQTTSLLVELEKRLKVCLSMIEVEYEYVTSNLSFHAPLYSEKDLDFLFNWCEMRSFSHLSLCSGTFISIGININLEGVDCFVIVLFWLVLLRFLLKNIVAGNNLSLKTYKFVAHFLFCRYDKKVCLIQVIHLIYLAYTWYIW